MSHAVVAVVGPADATGAVEETAEAVGRALGEGGATLICGGLGGVMAAACRGAQAVGATTIGLLPGSDRHAANAWVDIAIPTGLGELRNGLVVRAADAVIAIGGDPADGRPSYGTLSEIALALRTGIRVIGLGTWPIAGVVAVADPAAAVQAATRPPGSSRSPRRTGRMSRES